MFSYFLNLFNNISQFKYCILEANCFLEGNSQEIENSAYDNIFLLNSYKRKLQYEICFLSYLSFVRLKEYDWKFRKIFGFVPEIFLVFFLEFLNTIKWRKWRKNWFFSSSLWLPLQTLELKLGESFSVKINRRLIVTIYPTRLFVIN